jgi:hypothetical protein
VEPQPHAFIAWIPLLVLSMFLAVVCYRIAKEKGRNAVLFLVLGLIPIVNGLVALYVVGAPDLVLHAKIDSLLSRKTDGVPGGS